MPSKLTPHCVDHMVQHVRFRHRWVAGELCRKSPLGKMGVALQEVAPSINDELRLRRFDEHVGPVEHPHEVVDRSGRTCLNFPCTALRCTKTPKPQPRSNELQERVRRGLQVQLTTQVLNELAQSRREGSFAPAT